VLTRGGGRLRAALTGGGVRQVATSIPSTTVRDALLRAYRTGFASTLDHLMIIGSVVALVGSICGYALVRQRDFVPSYSPSSAPAPVEVHS